MAIKLYNVTQYSSSEETLNFVYEFLFGFSNYLSEKQRKLKV